MTLAPVAELRVSMTVPYTQLVLGCTSSTVLRQVRWNAGKCYNYKAYGGYSSAAERLTVAQDVVGSIPTSRPNGAPTEVTIRRSLMD